jgi:hypothetical protein
VGTSLTTILFLLRRTFQPQPETLQKASLVSPQIGNFSSYAGYFSTNETAGNNMFWWYFPPQNGNSSAPTVSAMPTHHHSPPNPCHHHVLAIRCPAPVGTTQATCRWLLRSGELLVGRSAGLMSFRSAGPRGKGSRGVLPCVWLRRYKFRVWLRSAKVSATCVFDCLTSIDAVNACEAVRQRCVKCQSVSGCGLHFLTRQGLLIASLTFCAELGASTAANRCCGCKADQGVPRFSA